MMRFGLISDDRRRFGFTSDDSAVSDTASNVERLCFKAKSPIRQDLVEAFVFFARYLTDIITVIRRLLRE